MHHIKVELLHLKYIILHKYIHSAMVWFGVMVFNATFYNFSVISWQSILLVEETEVPRENHQPAASN